MPKRNRTTSRSSQRTRKGAGGTAPQQGERLQKILAAAGVASRRDCEELIVAGRVMVDGQIVTKLGSRADPATQEIAVDGQILKRPKLVYYAVHKPKGVLSTNWDPSGRTRLVDLAPDDKRLFCVGRLDRSSEGLAMLTNDGELAHRVMHPRFGVSKTYVVEVAGSVTSKDVEDITKGVYLAEGRAKASKVRVKSRRGKSTLLEIELQEGKNREIRRIMAKLEHKVLNLKRIAIGPLRLGDMPAGAYRELSGREIAALRKESQEGESAPPRKRRRPPTSSKTGSAMGESLAWDDDYESDDDFSDELIEVRDDTPIPTRKPGAVIGGESEGRSQKKARGKGTASKGAMGGKTPGRGKPAPNKRSGGKGGARKGAGAPRGAKAEGRGGRPKRKGGR